MGSPQRFPILFFAVLFCFALLISAVSAQSLQLVSTVDSSSATIITSVDLSMPPDVAHKVVITIWGYTTDGGSTTIWEPIYIHPTNCGAPVSSTQQHSNSPYFPSWTAFTTTSADVMRCELNTFGAHTVHAQLAPVGQVGQDVVDTYSRATSIVPSPSIGATTITKITHFLDGTYPNPNYTDWAAIRAGITYHTPEFTSLTGFAFATQEESVAIFDAPQSVCYLAMWGHTTGYTLAPTTRTASANSYTIVAEWDLLSLPADVLAYEVLCFVPIRPLYTPGPTPGSTLVGIRLDLLMGSSRVITWATQPYQLTNLPAPLRLTPRVSSGSMADLHATSWYYVPSNFTLYAGEVLLFVLEEVINNPTFSLATWLPGIETNHVLIDTSGVPIHPPFGRFDKLFGITETPAGIAFQLKPGVASATIHTKVEFISYWYFSSAILSSNMTSPPPPIAPGIVPHFVPAVAGHGKIRIVGIGPQDVSPVFPSFDDFKITARWFEPTFVHYPIVFGLDVVINVKTQPTGVFDAIKLTWEASSVPFDATTITTLSRGLRLVTSDWGHHAFKDASPHQVDVVILAYDETTHRANLQLEITFTDLPSVTTTDNSWHRARMWLAPLYGLWFGEFRPGDTHFLLNGTASHWDPHSAIITHDLTLPPPPNDPRGMAEAYYLGTTTTRVVDGPLPSILYYDAAGNELHNTTQLSIGQKIKFQPMWDRRNTTLLMYSEDRLRFTDPGCFTNITCDSETLTAFPGGAYQVTYMDLEPLSPQDVFGTSCEATVSSSIAADITSCGFTVQVVEPMFSTNPHWAARYPNVTYSTTSPPNFALIPPQTYPHWRCRFPPNGNWDLCDGTTRDELLARNTCFNPLECSCGGEVVPECFDPTPGPTVACSNIAQPAPITWNINNEATGCAACHQNPKTLYNWGKNCDLLPRLSSVSFTLSHTQLDYANGSIQIKWEYSGSPHAQVTIYAKSTTFSPFNTIALATLPVATNITTTTPALNGHQMQYSFPLSQLPSNLAFTDLTFVVSASGGMSVESTQSFALPVRCLDANNTSTCLHTTLGGEGDGCNRITGLCECDKTTVWQLGENCEQSICSTLGCASDKNQTRLDLVTGELCRIQSTPSATNATVMVHTPQCNCAGNWSGPRCESLQTCASQWTDYTCPPRQGTPLFDEVNASCRCECDGEWTTPLGTKPTSKHCNKCGYTCLNQGKDYSNCGGMCTCPSTGSSLFYGAQCECKGIVLKAQLPIDTAKFDFIRQKKAEVKALMAQMQNAVQGNDLLSFMQRDAFKGFVTSLMQNFLVLHRDTLVLHNKRTADSIYTFNPETQQYEATAADVTKFASLIDFDVKEVQQQQQQQPTVAFTILVKTTERCHDAQSAIDDTTWVEMMHNVDHVANYLKDNNITLPPSSSATQDHTASTPQNDWLSVDDPDCENEHCKATNKPGMNNTAQSTPKWFTAGLVAIFAALCILL